MTGKTLNSAVLIGRGITSRQDIRVEVVPQSAGHGIIFELATADGGKVLIPATADHVVNTLRNVVIGVGPTRLCIVEHFMCAASIWGLDDILVKVDGPEMPLGDGSARLWKKMFVDAGWDPKPVTATRELPEPIMCKKGDRVLMAVPDDSFSVTYLMDWNHPAIGKCWQTWTPDQSLEEIIDPRTFGSMQEHQLLGIADEVVSLTADGFTQPLRWPNEPVRHKLLDVVGDLALAGVNPLSWKARFISIKGGHEMDVDMAKRLAAFVQ